MTQSLNDGRSLKSCNGAPIAKPGAGLLDIQSVAGESAVTSVWASSPLRILTPYFRGQSVWAYLSSFGGGMVAGDEMSLTLNLGKGTRCFLTTQSSTKVYSNPTRRPCNQIIHATLAAGSQLVLAPDPVQAFAGSSYSQSQQFDLEPGSSLVLVDWLCSGRLARGERWAFSRFESRIEVFSNSERILLDSLLLDPSDGRLDGQHRLGRFNCLALILVLGESLRNAAVRMLERAAEYPVTPKSSLLCSASPVHGGVLLRLVGERVEEVTRQVHLWLDFVPALLGDNPWARKW
jgi:urease accessory protein